MHVQEREVYKWALGLVTATFNFGTLFGTRFTAQLGFFLIHLGRLGRGDAAYKSLPRKCLKLIDFFVSKIKKSAGDSLPVNGESASLREKLG